ncbi:hypothetical protein NDA14_000884 [Ustilago hordei]|nr:hypothetical protein NDA14_000884 [Ustilago hordei]
MPSSSPSVTVLFPAAGDDSVFSSVSSFFSSLLPVVYAEEAPSEDNESQDNESQDNESQDNESEEESEEAEEEEDEANPSLDVLCSFFNRHQDEPEDPAPAIYEECEKSKACAPFKHHFDECTKRVEEGKGFEGENCIEEFFHLAHCAQECTAPKLFAKLV